MTHQGDEHVHQQDVGEHNVPNQQQVQQLLVFIAGAVIGNRMVIRVAVVVLFRLLLLPNHGPRSGDQQQWSM